MRTSLPALALALAAVFATPSAALAGGPTQYEVTDTAPGSVSSGTVNSGGAVEFCGAGFMPGTEVAVFVDGVLVGTVDADADGEFCVDVTLTGSGSAVITATGQDDDGAGLRVVTSTVTVVGTAAAPVRAHVGGTGGTNAAGANNRARTTRSSTSSLPRTGSDGTATQVWAGVGLLGLGGGLVALTVARRRETSGTA